MTAHRETQLIAHCKATPPAYGLPSAYAWLLAVPPRNVKMMICLAQRRRHGNVMLACRHDGELAGIMLAAS